MKIGILYDSSEAEARLLFDRVSRESTSRAEEVAVIDVAEAASAPCVCCFQCWTKTPGICVLKRDGGTTLSEKFWDARYVILISRITWGGLSVRVKLYLDRLIPILHPYFRKVNGEMHHQLRYDSFPIFLAAGYGARTKGEEETFRAYTSAIRDQGGDARARGTFVASGDRPLDAAIAECGAWFAEEVAL